MGLISLMKRYYYSFFLVFLLACKGKQEAGFVFQKKETINFKTAFRPNHMFSGAFVDAKSGEEYIYFGDLITEKKIVFYDLNGHKKNEIDFTNVIKENFTQVTDIYVKSLDSFYLYSDYSGQLVLSDKKGVCLKKRSMGALNSKEKEYYTSVFGNFGYQNSLFFVSSDPFNATTIEDVNKWYNDKNSNSYISQFNAVFDTAYTQTQHLSKFRSSFIPKNSLDCELSYYTVSKQYIFISSWYSNKVFCYDWHSKKMLRPYTIKSKKTNIGSKPSIIDEKNFQNMNELIKIAGSFKGTINRFFYDEKNKLLYVLVFHEQKDLRSQNYGGGRDFSLLIYDHKRIKVFEKSFASEDYSSGFSILTSKGLLVRKNEKFNRNLNVNDYRFDLFSFK